MAGLMTVSACLQDVASAEVVGWRGDGTGRFASAQPPLEWSAEQKKNILWKVRVGRGYSSPVAAGGRVFLTSEEDKLVCVDASTGKVSWENRNGPAELPGGTNATGKLPAREAGYATPTPVTDGRFVWASFGTGMVVCYDLAGNRKWIRHIEAPPASKYGRAGSPLFVEGRLIVAIGCLTALDPATGKTLWESKGAGEAFGTPAMVKIGGATVLFTGNGDCVRVSDGALLEKALGNSLYTTPVAGSDAVYFAGPQTVGVKLPAKLDGKPEFKRLWMTELEGEFFSSPVRLDGILYAANNQGVLSALDTKTGEILYQQHLDLPSQSAPPGVEPASIYPSLAIASDSIFLGNDKGDTLVIAPGREYRKIGQNALEEGAAGSPAFDGRLIFLRGGDFLYCIGAR